MPGASGKQPPPPPAAQFWDPLPRVIAEKADQANKHVQASARAAVEEEMHKKLMTGCVQGSCAAAHLFIPYLLQVKSGPMAMYWTPEGHQLKLGTAKEAKKGKGQWLSDCYGTWGTLKDSHSHISLKKTNNKLRNNAVAHVWLHKHTTVPWGYHWTGSRTAQASPNQPHHQSIQCTGKSTPSGERGFWEKQG